MKPWLLAALLAVSFVAKWVHHQHLLRAEQGILPVCELSSVVSKLYHSGKKGKIHYHRGHRVSWGFPPRKQKPCAPQPGAVSYELSGGRLGDNLLSYLHALWLSYKDNRPMHYVPFPMGEHFALSRQTSDTPIAVTVPYFPEPSMKNRSQPFFVDWDDPGFQDRVHKALAPTQPVKCLSLPSDRIRVAVHVRRPERFDHTSLYLEYPLKFPPDEYYLEQLRLVASVFRDKPLYIFLFTDALEPEKLLHQYKSTLSLPNTEWACTSNSKNVLEDFYSMTQFDCMILCDSSFSTTASKLGSYALRINPTHYVKHKGHVQVTGVNVAFNGTIPAQSPTSVQMR